MTLLEMAWDNFAMPAQAAIVVDKSTLLSPGAEALDIVAAI
jgi:hypothetical protein